MLHRIVKRSIALAAPPLQPALLRLRAPAPPLRSAFRGRLFLRSPTRQLSLRTTRDFYAPDP